MNDVMVFRMRMLASLTYEKENRQYLGKDEKKNRLHNTVFLIRAFECSLSKLETLNSCPVFTCSSPCFREHTGVAPCSSNRKPGWGVTSYCPQAESCR